MSKANITISSRAAKRINELVNEDQAASLFRVSVEGGGCSGFQYKFEQPPPSTLTRNRLAA